LFTELVRSFYKESIFSFGKRQLVSLYVVADYDRGLYAIAGDYSSTLCDWLNDMASKNDLEKIVWAMEHTYSYIWDRKMPTSYGTFLAYLHEGGCLTIQCPSHCIVCPRSSRVKHRGVEFDSSEVCNVGEVLVLLSGLSVLCEIAGRDIYGSSY
jgi:hypothetical protein